MSIGETNVVCGYWEVKKRCVYLIGGSNVMCPYREAPLWGVVSTLCVSIGRFIPIREFQRCLYLLEFYLCLCCWLIFVNYYICKGRASPLVHSTGAIDSRRFVQIQEQCQKFKVENLNIMIKRHKIQNHYVYKLHILKLQQPFDIFWYPEKFKRTILYFDILLICLDI